MKRKQVEDVTQRKMHRNNKYLDNPPNFAVLAEKHKLLLQYFGNFEWKSPAATIELTRVLLLEDYQINWTLPIHHLCPPVANRANYVHWINDLLQIYKSNSTKITGIDIGTGASCIYPLLGSRIYGWNFIGTDIDSVSLEHAQKNIDANSDLKQKIKLVHVDDEQKILVDVIDDKSYEFVMCNPPFFTEEESNDESRNPRTNTQATDNEWKTSGGEVAFVKRMIDDSVSIGDRITWYTSMLGKKSSLSPLKEYLKSLNIEQIYTTEFIQGKTMRWGIAWTYAVQVKQKTIEKNQISTIVVSRVMRQTVFHYLDVSTLFKDIIKVVEKKCKITKKDVMMGSVTGSLDGGDKFSVQVMQLQPKQYVVQVEFLDKKKQPTGSFQELYETISKNIFRS